MNYICTCCGKRTPTTTKEPRCECGGLFELNYTPPKRDESLIDKSELSQFRSRRFMPFEVVAWKVATVGDGMTALVLCSDAVMRKVDYHVRT